MQAGHQLLNMKVVIMVTFGILFLVIFLSKEAEAEHHRFFEIDDNENINGEIEEELDEDLEEHQDLFKAKRDAWFIPKYNARRRCTTIRQPACKTTSNGCGPELTQSHLGKFNYINKALMTASCNKHDNCYDCHDEYGWNRSACDERFKKDLESRCNCHYNKLSDVHKRLVCLSQANIMYGAVKAGGGSFIRRVNNDLCYQQCVDAIANPYRSVTE